MLDTWFELTTQLGIKNSLYSMYWKSYNNYNSSAQYNALKLLVPLPFWFCRSIDRSLPLISMQYTDVKIIVQFKSFDKCWYKLTTIAPTSNNIMISKR
jgi:hypothetical protein